MKQHIPWQQLPETIYSIPYRLVHGPISDILLVRNLCNPPKWLDNREVAAKMLFVQSIGAYIIRGHDIELTSTYLSILIDILWLTTTFG